MYVYYSQVAMQIGFNLRMYESIFSLGPIPSIFFFLFWGACFAASKKIGPEMSQARNNMKLKKLS